MQSGLHKEVCNLKCCKLTANLKCARNVVMSMQQLQGDRRYTSTKHNKHMTAIAYAA